jgi:hypothetical protein
MRRVRKLLVLLKLRATAPEAPTAPDYAIITSAGGGYVRPNAADYVVTRV